MRCSSRGGRLTAKASARWTLDRRRPKKIYKRGFMQILLNELARWVRWHTRGRSTRNCRSLYRAYTKSNSSTLWAQHSSSTRDCGKTLVQNTSKLQIKATVAKASKEFWKRDVETASNSSKTNLLSKSFLSTSIPISPRAFLPRL